MREKKKLRSGYTTGACAAAAAKAASMLAIGHISSVTSIDIPFPDGSRHEFHIHASGLNRDGRSAWASVIKDAGDDPDITNGAEIRADAVMIESAGLLIKGGKGVGTVTKPGLAIAPGEPAINPIPRKMIAAAIAEVAGPGSPGADIAGIEITISVADGERLAEKTLNRRLGIIGGISILGSTGIVKPVSTEAWTATITSSMDVAKAAGLSEIVVSAGRASERAHMEKFHMPEEAYVLMGDYLEYSIKDAVKHGFKKIHLCAQWAKMVKIAMATPQTHVRFGAIDIAQAVEFFNLNGIAVPRDREFNTAREIFDFIRAGNTGPDLDAPLQAACTAAKLYAEQIAEKVTVQTYLVSYDNKIIMQSN
ncbi:MAG: cobalamin biosynthesis protein CbiD [Nitrospira sp.]|nr:cobalamin biosynthesis protein CbiD [bacterium]MBL7048699.1 cobalamin biosynthesis protein CbiD [Nitrospira sp.]